VTAEPVVITLRFRLFIFLAVQILKIRPIIHRSIAIFRNILHDSTGANFMKRSLNCIAAVCIAASLPLSALAESSFQTGTGPLSSSANLDFQVTIPAVLYLQVGAGSALGTNTNISKIDFVVPSASVGNGSTIVAQGASGDLQNGRVTARVVGNNGPIDFSAATTGAMLASGATTGNSDSISWSEIAVGARALTTPTSAAYSLLSAPALVDGSVTTVKLTPAIGRTVQQEAEWDFSYLNSKVVNAGTYGDTSGNGGNNGRVTYTASMP